MALPRNGTQGVYRTSDDDDEEYTELAPPRQSQWARVMSSPSLTITLQILGSVAAAGAGTARPLTAILFGNLVNLYNSTNEVDLDRLKHTINSKVLLFFCIFLGQWVLVCAYGILFSVSAMRYTMRLRALYLKAVISQDIEEVSSSNAATDLSAYASVIEDALAEKLGTVLQAASTVITSLTICFYWSWRLTLALVFVIVVLVSKDVITTMITAKLERRTQAIEAEATSVAEECFSSIRTVTALRALTKFKHRYSNILNKAQKGAMRKSPVAASHHAVAYFTVLGAYALAFWYGTKLLDRGRIESGGAVVIVIISLNTGINALVLLLPLYGLIAKAFAAHYTLKSVIKKPPRVDPFSQHGNRFIPLYSRIEFRDVNLEYPSRPSVKVLRDLNVTFGAGKVTAIIGPSGCGKSSIVALLQRFYKSSSGTIRIHGENIESYNVKSLRSSIRVVQQDPVLFNDSILNNIVHGLIGSPFNGLSDREKRRLVTKVCKDIEAHEFICQLPDGYDTVVGNRGSLLSGGQRQRVAIARAIISNPAILVFDEATSALDPDSERIVQAAINRVARGRTTIIIAHKLATIKHADRIIMIKNGSVVEEGSHESLLRTSDEYVRTWMAQNLVPEERTDGSELSSSDRITPFSTADPEKIGHKHMSTARTKGDIDNATIDMTQNHPVSFLKTVAYIASGSRRLKHISGVNIMVCVITGAIYPSQAFIFGHEVVSFQKSPADMVRSIEFWSWMFFVLSLISLVSFSTLGILSSIGGTITSRVFRERYFRGLLDQPMAFFDKSTNTPGLLVSCLSSHPNHLQGFVVILSSLAVTTVNLTSVSILGLIVSWRFALVAIFGAVPVISLAGFLRIQFQSKRSKNLSDPLVDSAQYAAEVIGNIRTVSSFAMEAEVCSTLARKMNIALRMFYRNTFITMPLFAFSHSGNILGVTFSFWYAGTLITEHKISALHFWIIFFGIVTGSEATSEFFARATSIVHARSACSHIARVSAPTTDADTKSTYSEKPGPGNAITFDRVSFAYTNVPDIAVLHDVSIQIPSRQHIAIVGPSGSGKSTIISLLERFYEPSSGQIRLGTSLLSDTDIDEYRDRVSLVSQDTQLFDGTIRDNILLGVPVGEESEETTLQAARDAHIHDFIVGLPDGYNTQCGPKGAFFSGGQRQRLAIARALVRNPTILLLDEATSSLDSENEAEVKKALRDASAGRTTVSVAHRLSTIRDADCIYVLVGGRIAESGTHEDLMRRRSVYWRLCQRQNLD